MQDSTIAELLASATDVNQAIEILTNRGVPLPQARIMAGIHFGQNGGDRLDANGNALPFLDLEEELAKQGGGVMMRTQLGGR